MQRKLGIGIVALALLAAAGPLAQVGMWAISSAVAEQPTIAQPQLSFCYFACLTL